MNRYSYEVREYGQENAFRFSLQELLSYLDITYNTLKSKFSKNGDKFLIINGMECYIVERRKV